MRNRGVPRAAGGRAPASTARAHGGHEERHRQRRRDDRRPDAAQYNRQRQAAITQEICRDRRRRGRRCRVERTDAIEDRHGTQN
ncbi:MAG: hypothetical protein MZU95_03765 [Desulfomicrobium escambiense]|nr:hypothetical protein [Desulfomicrobium escambiense]